MKLDGVEFGLSAEITCLSTQLRPCSPTATNLWNGLAMAKMESELVTELDCRGSWGRSMKGSMYVNSFKFYCRSGWEIACSDLRGDTVIEIVDHEIKQGLLIPRRSSSPWVGLADTG